MPLLGTFFYPWYGGSSRGWKHWKNQRHDPPKTWTSNFLPDLPLIPSHSGSSLEDKLYDSSDARVMIWQLGLMKRAKLDFAISSWWGQKEFSDDVFRSLLLDVSKRGGNPSPALKWCLYYEKEGYSNPSEAEIIADLDYIVREYGGDSRYLKIDKKPVVFVYSNSENQLGYVEKWGNVRRKFGDVYLVLKIVQGYRSVSNVVDSWHQYAPANRFAVQAPYWAFVSPGFWKYDEAPKLGRDLEAFKDAVRQMKSTNVQFWLVQTWNEYHEGTMLEPASEVIHDDRNPPFKISSSGSYGTLFIDALAQ